MIKLIPTILLALFLVLPNIQAQDRDDLLKCIQLVMEDPEVQDLYQHDLSSGPTAVFEMRETSVNNNPIEQLVNQLTNDDFWDFDQPIQFVTKSEAAGMGIEVPYLISLSIRGSDKEFTLMLATSLQEEIVRFHGVFTLQKTFSGWELTNKTVQKRR